MNNETTKRNIDWLERLGFQVDVLERDHESKYLPRYEVAVTKGKDFQSSGSFESIDEVNAFMRGYIYAIIDMQYNTTFNV